MTIQDSDTGRYLQPNGTLAAAFATCDATLATPGAHEHDVDAAASTCPARATTSVTAYAYDTAGQQDTSTTGATARYRDLPG